MSDASNTNIQEHPGARPKIKDSLAYVSSASFTDSSHSSLLSKGGVRNIRKVLKDNTMVALMDTQIATGQAISIQPPGQQQQYFVKVGSGEYVNIATGKTITGHDLVSYMSTSSYRVVSKREIFDKIKSQGLLNQNMKHIEMDIETSLKIQSKNPTFDQVYQIAAVEFAEGSSEITGRINMLNYKVLKEGIDAARKTVNYLDEHFDPNELSNKRVQQQILENWKSGQDMSNTLRRTYMNLIRTYIKDDSELLEHVEGRNGYHILQGTKGKTIIGNERGIRTYLREFATDVQQRIANNELTISSFNPGGLDQSLLDMLLRTSEDNPERVHLDLGDSRMFALAQQALLYHTTGPLFNNAVFPMYNKVLDQLGIAGSIRQELLMALYHGPTSKYNPASSEESLYNIIQAAKKGGVSKRFVEAHEGIQDAVDAVNMIYSTNNLIEEAFNESNTKIVGNVQKRMVAAYLKELTTRKVIDSRAGRSFVDAAGHKSAAYDLFYKFFDKTTDLERAKNKIETDTMAFAGRKMIGNLFGEARYQYELYKDVMLDDVKASTAVNSFLMGAFGAGFIKWAVTKAKARAKEEMLSEPEGLNHNSLPTIVRRLQLSDFGSARSPGNWTSLSYYLFKSIFEEARAKGLGKSVSNFLKHANNYVKHVVTTRSFKSAEDKVQPLKSSAKILGKDLFHKILKKDTEFKQTTKKVLKKTYEAASNLYNKTKHAYQKVSFDKHLLKRWSGAVVDKWKELPGETRIYIGSGLALGVGGAMILNTMRGSYDPYYDYHDYIERDYSLPRNYRQNIQYIRALRNVHNLAEQRLEEDESTTRFIQRQRYSDFGSKIQPLISGMWEKSVYKWGKLRPSLSKAVEMVRNTFRIFKKEEPKLIIQSNVPRLKMSKSKLRASITKAAYTSMEKDSALMTDAVNSVIERPTNYIPSASKGTLIPDSLRDIEGKASRGFSQVVARDSGKRISITHANAASVKKAAPVRNGVTEINKRIINKGTSTPYPNVRIDKEHIKVDQYVPVNGQVKHALDAAAPSYTTVKPPKLAKDDKISNFMNSDVKFRKIANRTAPMAGSDEYPFQVMKDSRVTKTSYPQKIGTLSDKLPKGEAATADYLLSRNEIPKVTPKMKRDLYVMKQDRDLAYKAHKYEAQITSNMMLTRRFGKLHRSYGSFMPYEAQSPLDIDFMPAWY